MNYERENFLFTQASRSAWNTALLSYFLSSKKGVESHSFTWDLKELGDMLFYFPVTE